MFDRFEFLFNEAMIALRRNLLMTFAAISTVAVSLFLIGGLAFAYLQASDYARTIPGKFEMRVSLRMGATKDDIKETAAKIRDIPTVKEVSWIPRDKYWALWQKENPKLAGGLDNPFPDAFKVTISDLSRGDEVADQIRHLRAVAEGEKGVVYLKEEQNFVQEWLEFFRFVGLLVGGLLTVTGWILIYNAIRLTVQSRRLEIRIMQLVGASRFTVQIPFMIEGIVQGAVGGVIATLLIQGSYTALEKKLSTLQAGSSFPPFPLGMMMLTLVGVGVLYGLVCSAIAVRRPLRYR